MYIEKYEIAPKLANLRGAVPCSKQGAIPAGMLIDGDTVTAVNEIMQISANCRHLWSIRRCWQQRQSHLLRACRMG